LVSREDAYTARDSRGYYEGGADPRLRRLRAAGFVPGYQGYQRYQGYQGYYLRQQRPLRSCAARPGAALQRYYGQSRYHRACCRRSGIYGRVYQTPQPQRIEPPGYIWGNRRDERRHHAEHPAGRPLPGIDGICGNVRDKRPS
jgi:hypothetical protein